MKEFLVPFDRKFKRVLETLNILNRLDILPLDKRLVERNFCLNRSQIQLSGSQELLNAGRIEIRQRCLYMYNSSNYGSNRRFE